MKKVNLAEKFALFEDRWYPKLVGSIDEYDIKLVKLEGEFLVVPKGVEHRPRAERECQVLLLERKGMANTGDAPDGELTRHSRDRI